MSFPAWFEYLQIAYPRERIEKPPVLCAIISKHFEEVGNIGISEKQRMEVVKRAVATCERWPAVATLRELASQILYSQPDVEQQEDNRKEYRDAAARQRDIWLSELSQMPICPHCGENTPDMLNCPFCEDMSEQASQEPAGEVVSWLIDVCWAGMEISHV